MTGMYQLHSRAYDRSTDETVDFPEQDIPHTPTTFVSILPDLSCPSCSRIAPRPFSLAAPGSVLGWKLRSAFMVGISGSLTIAMGSPPLFNSEARSLASQSNSEIMLSRPARWAFHERDSVHRMGTSLCCCVSFRRSTAFSASNAARLSSSRLH